MCSVRNLSQSLKRSLRGDSCLDNHVLEGGVCAINFKLSSPIPCTEVSNASKSRPRKPAFLVNMIFSQDPIEATTRSSRLSRETLFHALEFVRALERSDLCRSQKEGYEVGF